MLLSNVKELVVSSAYRSPEAQARVMFDNLSNGVRIKYAAPGAAVTARYDMAKQAGQGPEEIKRLMANEIYRLGPEEVSKHASPPDWLNVVDIRPSSICAENRIKFIKAANRFVGTYISKFLHPGNSKDPAYHIEIPQGKLIAVKGNSI